MMLKDEPNDRTLGSLAIHDRMIRGLKLEGSHTWKQGYLRSPKVRHLTLRSHGALRNTYELLHGT